MFFFFTLRKNVRIGTKSHCPIGHQKARTANSFPLVRNVSSSFVIVSLVFLWIQGNTFKVNNIYLPREACLRRIIVKIFFGFIKVTIRA